MQTNLIVGTIDNTTGYAIITVNLAASSAPDAKILDGKRALIDTGATNSAIDVNLIAELGLEQKSTQDSYAFDRVIHDVPFYAGRIVIPELSWAWDLRSIAPVMGNTGNYDAIIGNDILASCTLMMTGPANKFALMRGTPGDSGFSQASLSLQLIVRQVEKFEPYREMSARPQCGRLPLALHF